MSDVVGADREHPVDHLFSSSNSCAASVDTSPRLSAILLSNVEIHEFRIARDDTNRYGLADLRIFGAISIVVVEQLEIAPIRYAPVPEVVDLPMAHIEVTVAIRWNHNRQLEGIEPTGVAVIVPPYDDMLGDDDVYDLEVQEFRATALKVPGQRKFVCCAELPWRSSRS